MAGYVSLHTHTEHSALDGLARIASLPKKAKELGMTALSITDHGSLAGVWKFVKACQDEGIKPVVGMEAYMAIGSRLERNEVTVERNDDEEEGMGDADEGSGKLKSKRYEHLTIIAKTEQGWKNLLAIHNEAAKPESYWYKPRADYELLKKYGEGLIVLSGCLAGPVAGPLSRDEHEEAEKNLQTLIDCVGKDNVFLEIMYHGIRAEKKIIKPIKELGEKYGIPLVATNDSHYETCDHAHAHDAFLAVGTRANLDTPGRFKFNGEGYWLKSEQEMLDVFPGNETWAKAVAQSQVIADLVEDCVVPAPKMRLPKFDFPEGFDSAEAFLHHLILKGAKERYGTPLTKEVKERLKVEETIINDMGFADYFLTTWDFINWCRSDLPVEYDNPDAPRKKPIVMGLGRGSAAGSCVSYCLGIVGVDPLENDLLFERFLEPGRTGMPDIDIDTESSRRDEALRYLIYRWGEENCAQIGSYGVAKTKAAIKDAARVLQPSGNSRDERERASQLLRLSSKMADLVPASGEKPYSFAQLDNTSDPATEAFWELAAENEEDVRAILDLARAFEDVAKSPSIHPCGFVVSPEPLAGIVPLRRSSYAKTASPDDPWIICWDGTDVDDYGLLKMDVLGLMNLNIVSQALHNIEEARGEKIVFEHVPDPDTKGDPRVDAAWALMGKGRTAGMFQMESAGMQKIAQDVAPDCLTDVSAVVALFRPGPLAAKVPDTYAARKKGLEAVSYDQFTKDKTEQEWIAKVLDNTYGVFVFQEQLMLLGTVIAGFDAKQRSVLRKAVGKKKADEMAKVGTMLIEGAEKEFHDEDGNLISPKFSKKTAAHVFELMKGSASYLFNAAHSAAYGKLAYITAYLKANYPVEYGAAILAVADKDDKRRTALASLREDGIEVQAPDVNSSKALTAPVGEVVRLGLAEVKGVGSAGHHVVAEREKGGEFTSLHELMARVKVPNPNTASGWSNIQVNPVQALIEAGALDSMEGSRLGKIIALRAAQKAEVAPVDAEWHPVDESTRQRHRLGVALGVPILKDPSVAGKLRDWRAPERQDQWGNTTGGRLTPMHKVSDRNGASVMTAGVIADWAEKGGRSGRRANLLLEATTTTLPAVVWDKPLAKLRRSGITPAVGDIVAVSGTLRVRQVSLGDEESGTADTMTVKEISVTEMWPIEAREEPAVAGVTNLASFAERYRKAKALQLPEPERPARKAAAKTPPPAKAAPKTAEAPAAEPEEAVAKVIRIETKRPARHLRLDIDGYGTSLVDFEVIDGDGSLQKDFGKVRVPVEIEEGSIFRMYSRTGDRILMAKAIGALTSEELLSSVPADDSPRWEQLKGSDGNSWYRLRAEPVTAVEGSLVNAVA